MKPIIKRLSLALCAAVATFGVAAPALAVAGAHALTMYGEPAAYGPDFTHFPHVNPHAPKGGTLRLASQGTFDTLNGYILKGTAAESLGLIYDSMMVGGADEPFTMYCHLCRSVDMPEDRSSVTFHMRPEARWHDGKPITADDVVFSFNTLMEKGHPAYKQMYAQVAAVEKIDTFTVQYTLQGPMNRELPLIVGNLPVLPKHYWEATGNDFTKTTLTPPLGSGPYKIGEVDPGRALVFERVENYWAKDLPTMKGRYNFNTIRYDYYRDGNVMLEAFKAGEYDLRAENVSRNWAAGYEVAAKREGRFIKGEFPSNVPQGMQGFAMNTRRAVFADRRVRQAIGLAFDFEWTNRSLFYEAYTRTRSYFANSELAATGLPQGRELELLEQYRDELPPEVFSKPFKLPEGGDHLVMRRHYHKALELLTQAGWRVDPETKKLVDENGTPFTFEFLVASPSMERVVLPFIGNLKRLGIEASVRTVDASQYVKRLQEFDFDVTTFVWGQSFSPGNEQRNYWSSEAAATPGSRNFIGITDPVVDALVERIAGAESREELVAAARALDRVLLWGFYVVPHWHITIDRIAYWNKFGLPETVPLKGVDYLGSWWLDEQKAAALEGR